MSEILTGMNIERFLVFVLSLSALVLAHEWGHFAVARRCGVGVREFALGFGPRLVSWTSRRSGTRYRLNLVPLGGYCAMIGEDGERSPEDVAVAGGPMTAIGPWRRLAIIAAGPVVNLVVAFLLVWIAAATVGAGGGTASNRVGHLVPGDPAERAGLRPGDAIVAIDGAPVTDGAGMIRRINASLGRTLTIRYERDGETRTLRAAPVAATIGGRRVGILGFAPLPVYDRASPVAAFGIARERMGDMVGGTFDALTARFRRTPDAAAEGTMLGPIGIARAAVAVQSYGPQLYLPFVALLSVSLGVFNLLPFPALDGGRALFILFEIVRGKPIDPGREALVHLTGFAAIVALVIVISYHDIRSMAAGQPVF